MLVTALAFIFIPVSLAGTVFGMNVQQINQTGPDITAFAITAVIMIACALLLWAIFGALTSYRRSVVSEFNAKGMKPWDARSWRERILFVGFTMERMFL